ncbi:MAG: DUF305 domain-containing protein [Actinomycetota bacterium]|nr:DUF305 domain-containing protein [Actinomycetota bacterium]
MATPARLGALVCGVTLALALSACGGEDSSNASDSGTPPAAALSASEISQENNDADVQFTQQMIPHHRQATVMAELAGDRAESEQVKTLAEEIIAAQQPEIDTMNAMLEKWGEVMSGDGSMGGMGMGEGGMETGGMNGMMTPQQMTELENASGGEFDRLFLQMMIAHHEGAVEMARAEQADGQNPQAIELAERIDSSQTDEIERMRGLLSTS